jgi:lipopolysaccharide transport protein LptA
VSRVSTDRLSQWLCGAIAVAVVTASACAAPPVAADSGANGNPVGSLAGPSTTPTTPPAAPPDAPTDVAVTGAAGVPEVVAPPATPRPAIEGDAFGIRFDSDRPVSIRSDELESSKTQGTRKLVFIRNVVVEQDDVTIRSQRLEAFYPPDASQPSRMIASGQVFLSNGRYEARCDRATYLRAEDTLTCTGNAEMREDDDCVAGEWIVFDLEAETIKVGGGATVVLGGEKKGGGTGVCL